MAIVRTGVAWSSLVCWLVILIGAGSSEVGAQSAPEAEAGSMYAQGHRRFGAIVPTRRSGGKVYRSARRAHRENAGTQRTQRATSQCDLSATQEEGQ